MRRASAGNALFQKLEEVKDQLQEADRLENLPASQQAGEPQTYVSRNYSDCPR